jgi:fimbrial chaperone protein
MWQRSTFKRAAAVFIAIAGFAMGSGRAATFAVDPISVSLAKGNSSTAVAVTNQSPQKLRLQITGFAWQQKPSGEMQLTPTDDLVFFPQLLTLDPGETPRKPIAFSWKSCPPSKA